MLQVNSDTVQHIMELAREFHAQDAVIDGDWMTRMLAPHGEDLALAEFRAAVKDLTPDQQQDLVALYWLGRGDFDPDEWPAAVEQARRSWNTRTAEYLICHPQLAEHLSDGLALLDHDDE